MGQLVYASGLASGGGGSAGGSGGGPNARYAYLVARLRNRQMTMEEATELFNLMQGMLQTSESARVALLRIRRLPPRSRRRTLRRRRALRPRQEAAATTSFCSASSRWERAPAYWQQ